MEEFREGGVKQLFYLPDSNWEIFSKLGARATH